MSSASAQCAGCKSDSSSASISKSCSPGDRSSASTSSSPSSSTGAERGDFVRVVCVGMPRLIRESMFGPGEAVAFPGYRRVTINSPEGVGDDNMKDPERKEATDGEGEG